MPFAKVTVSAGRKRVFDSVFPTSKLEDLAPTPAATPIFSASEPGQPFGGHFDKARDVSEASAAAESIPEQVVWDRHWHTATSFLTFPDKALIADEDVKDLKNFRTRLSKPKQDVSEALAYLASQRSKDSRDLSPGPEHNLNAWYVNEVRRHFLGFIRPALMQVSVCCSLRPAVSDMSSFCKSIRIQ